jgi:hypothetical protein
METADSTEKAFKASRFMAHSPLLSVEIYSTDRRFPSQLPLSRAAGEGDSALPGGHVSLREVLDKFGDREAFFFDKNDLLTHYGMSLNAGKASYGFPF